MAIQPPSRVAPVDALRGIALFGLFSVHMIEFFELYWSAPPSQPSLVHQIIFGLFGGKAFALLALCFGFSFHILFDRARQKGEDFTARFAWRMVLLGGIGFVHSLIYRGDIITVLAIFGLILIPLDRVKSNRLLAVLAVICFAQPMLLARIIAANAGVTWGMAQPGYYSDPAMPIYLTGGFLDLIQANLGAGSVNKWAFYTETGRVFQMFGLFLMGMIAGRTGFFAPEKLAERRLPVLASVALVMLFGLQLLRAHLEARLGGDPGVGLYTRLLLSAWCELSAMALWVFGFLWAWTGPLSRALAAFVPAGRMTLTLYIGQSFVFVPFFYPFGLGAYGKFDQGTSLLIGLVAFAVQMAFASWWLRSHHFGPLEWLWRAGTYRSLSVPWHKAG